MATGKTIGDLVNILTAAGISSPDQILLGVSDLTSGELSKHFPLDEQILFLADNGLRVGLNDGLTPDIAGLATGSILDTDFLMFEISTGGTPQKITRSSLLASAPGSNLGPTLAASSFVITNDRGTGVTIPAATTSDAGVFTAADKTKLDGIAAGATAYTHPNHSGEVTSVGDGSTTISVGAVTTAKIADSAVTSDKLATDAVISAKIANGQVVQGKLATDSVSTVKIVDANVTLAKLAADAITDLAIGTPSATTVTITNSTGTDAVLPAATVTDAGVMTAAQVAQLNAATGSAGLPLATPRVNHGNISANQTIDWSANTNHQQCTVNQNWTVAFANPSLPQVVTLMVVMDGTGSYTFDWSSVPLNGPQPLINTVAGAVTIVRMYWDGNNYKVL